MRFCFQACRGQGIYIAEFVLGILKPFDLDKAFFGQFCKAVIDLPQADPHLLCNFTLGDLAVVVDDFKQAVMNFRGMVVHGVNNKKKTVFCQDNVVKINLTTIYRGVLQNTGDG